MVTFACGDWLDPRGYAPVGVFWECQNSAQRQLFTLWQVHADLHGGVSKLQRQQIQSRTEAKSITVLNVWFFSHFYIIHSYTFYFM